MASNWLYSGYTNPYYATVIAAQPAQTTVVYDYSQPINVTAEAPNPAAESSTEQVFSAARDAFKAGDFQRALDLTDQVLKDTPNVPVVHEFRASVSSRSSVSTRRRPSITPCSRPDLAGTGPPWSAFTRTWTPIPTSFAPSKPRSGATRARPRRSSCLATITSSRDTKTRLPASSRRSTQLQPSDQLSASFVKALKKVSEQPAGQPAQVNVAAAGQPAGATAAPAQPAAPAALPAQPAAEQPQQPEPPPPPPASLVGTWKAQPAADLSIALTLQADGQFAWEVDSKGQKQTLTGQAGFKDNTLALLQEDGPPLVGKITEEGGTKFVFTPTGGQKAPGLTFTKS